MYYREGTMFVLILNPFNNEEIKSAESVIAMILILGHAVRAWYFAITHGLIFSCGLLIQTTRMFFQK